MLKPGKSFVGHELIIYLDAKQSLLFIGNIGLRKIFSNEFRNFLVVCFVLVSPFFLMYYFVVKAKGPASHRRYRLQSHLLVLLLASTISMFPFLGKMYSKICPLGACPLLPWLLLSRYSYTWFCLEAAPLSCRS